ncbi:MAG: acetate--CoA ligase family protein [Nitrospirae bacterium]|nr:acetate--CoA ligase family protein [Nitrospirota bacterium]
MPIQDLIEQTKGKKNLLEHEVKGLLREMGMPVPKGIFTAKGKSIPQPLNLTFPLIAKVSSSKIASKSDVKGVRPGLKNEDELENAVSELMRIEYAQGVLIEEMAPHGLEVIVGGVIDNQFGPVVMFGLGGVFVELFKDVAFALAPMQRDDALWLIRQVKGYKLLEGYRGNPPVDKEALVKIIISISEIITARSIEEIDLNPVSLYPEGAMVLDAKMLLATVDKS